MISSIVSICVLSGVFVASLCNPMLVKPPEIVNFDVSCKKLDIEARVSLVPVKTYLANENLPVWIPEPGNPTQLRPINSVMKKLGPFTAYQDPDTCSTALYFHKKQQFEGTIGHHHIIHNLDYDPSTNKVKVSQCSVFESPLQKHAEKLGENAKTIMKKPGPIIEGRVKSLRKYPHTVYVEILVMIDHDITRDLKQDYTSVVTYVLTLFNSVDMLYSKIKIPNIKINIAGIIIASDENSFPVLEKCYDKEWDNNNQEPFSMDSACADPAIRRTLRGYHQLPPQSYDIVVFLTRASLYINQPENDRLMLRGDAFGIVKKTGYQRSLGDTGSAIISDPKNFQHFPIVAHEIAHLLGVPHDGGPVWDTHGKCMAHLMKERLDLCMKCLRFGGESPSLFEKFFGTRDACIFHNKPRSLNDPPGPQLFWTGDDQCQCYGYKSIERPKKTFWMWYKPSSPVQCDEMLKCSDDENVIHNTNYYMNGTPCGKHEVCWDKQCVPVQRYNKKKRNSE